MPLKRIWGKPHPSKKSSPEGLLARTLLRRFPEAEEDEDLDEELESLDETQPDVSPYVLMALAERALQKNETDKAASLFKRSALRENAPARAIHRSAIVLGQNGHLDAASKLLITLWDKYPSHGSSLATAAGIAFFKDQNPQDDNLATSADGKTKSGESTKKKRKKKRKKKKAIEDTHYAAILPFILEKIRDESRNPDDVAAAALMVAALSLTDHKNDDLVGEMMSRAIGSSENSPAAKYPILLAQVLDLYLLQLEGKKARDLLETHESIVEEDLQLLKHRVRARVLKGIPSKKLHGLRSNSKITALQNSINFPGGSMRLTFERSPVPFQSIFHSSFFPENDLRLASAQPNLSLSRFQKQMKILSEVRIAQTALEQGATKKASGYLNRIRKDAKYESSFHMMEALLKTKMKDDIGAMESIDEAITIAPNDPKVILAAARIQQRVGKPAEVLKTLRRLKREKYVSPNAFALEARAYLEKGDLQSAERALNRAAAINALDGEVMATFIFFHHEAADIGSALSQAYQLYKMHRAGFGAAAAHSPVLQAYYCGALAKNNKVNTAISILEKLSKEFEDIAIIHYFLGSAYREKGNQKKSRNAFNEVKRIGGPVEKWAAEN